MKQKSGAGQDWDGSGVQDGKKLASRKKAEVPGSCAYSALVLAQKWLLDSKCVIVVDDVSPKVCL